jgi:hypothetical protein
MTILYRFIRLISFILLSIGAVYFGKCDIYNTTFLLIIIFIILDMYWPRTDYK